MVVDCYHECVLVVSILSKCHEKCLNRLPDILNSKVIKIYSYFYFYKYFALLEIFLKLSIFAHLIKLTFSLF